MSKKLENLSNATPEFLVDELGKIRDQKKELEAQESFYKQALKARRGDETHIVGEVYEASVAMQERTGLDTQKIKEDHDEAWLEKYSKTTEYEVLRTSKRKAA